MLSLDKCHAVEISIHAPARGATGDAGADIVFYEYFNPRSREGSDSDRHCTCTKSSYISIHAPARGATIIIVYKFIYFCDFNPRSREGSDSVLHVETTTTRYFNPRSREGSDIHSQS